MKPTYTKLAADGSDLPADSTEKHLAVRVDHPLLKAPLIVAAYRATDRATFADAQKLAAAHDAYGWNWRTPTVEEAFLIVDRTNPKCELDKNFFPDAEGYEWTWTSTVDAELEEDDEGTSSPSDCAWLVGLAYGNSCRSSQSYHSRVRAVRAGQF